MTSQSLQSIPIFLSLFLTFPSMPHAKTAQPQLPALSLPIDCTLGKDCFIQNYVDLDPSKGVRDATCGLASYNGHKGTDFALISIRQMIQGVRVIAALPGRVIGIRNNMPDRRIKNPKFARAVKGRECGNGIVVQHKNGWQTQYCHLRKGSIKVKKGQRLKRGQMIGFVGLSGMTQFPHVHLSLRHHKKVIDPFLGLHSLKTCSITSALSNSQSLWHQNIKDIFQKQTSIIYQSGFAGHVVHRTELSKRKPSSPTSVHTPALILYANIANMRKGDRLQFQIFHQNRIFLENKGKPLNRHKAQYMAFAGKKKKRQWKAGRYRGRIKLMRKGKAILTKEHIITLK